MSEAQQIPQLALVGMPNVGKTALFNALTGSSQKEANFAGVTVEKKLGTISDQAGGRLAELVDLPGLYSLDIATLDEKISRDVLIGKNTETKLDGILLVLDATQLQKSLFLAVQLKTLGIPFTVLLNQIDESIRRGQEIDTKKLSKILEREVYVTSAATGEGLREVVSMIRKKNNWEVRSEMKQVDLAQVRKLEFVKKNFQDVDTMIEAITIKTIRADRFSEKVDLWVLHPFWGVVILLVLLVLIFNTLFSWAGPVQDLIEWSFSWLGAELGHHISHPIVRSLLVDGVIAGVGSIIIFLPQILLLFFFIQLLEDIGYLGRAAFLMDSFMRRMGLPGKAAIPLISSHACAIPGIMATRILESRRERLICMMILPVTTCSARLPVYTLLIAALVPASLHWGPLSYQALSMLALYMVALVLSLVLAIIFKKVLPAESPSMLLMELPSYRRPKIKNLWRSMWSKGKVFVQKAGGVILILSLVIWVLVSFPMQKDGSLSPIEQSYAARVGKTISPIFSPMGFDWRITTALIPSFGAREIMIASLSTVLAVQTESQDGGLNDLQKVLSEQFSVGTLMALLAWFIFAPQCISTIAIIKRESMSWKWPLVMVSYTLCLAYAASFIAYRLFT